jgi:hypothetical protein
MTLRERLTYREGWQINDWFKEELGLYVDFEV